MKRRVLCMILAIMMLCTMLPLTSFMANAATALSATPYPDVEYGYTPSVSVGTIRYIAQNRDSEYFSWNYWPSSSFGSYGKPEKECGTACISMALSYVGVDRTPKALLEATNGVTAHMWGSQDSATSKSIAHSTSAISSAMDDYINGNGKYSPLCVYIVPFSATSEMHWVLLVGKLGENKYLALNPWHSSGTNGTFIVQINGTTATYNGITNPISSVNQWYNPIATPALIKKTYPANCTVKTNALTYIKSLPCSEKTDANSTNLEIASEGETYQVIGLVENSVGNLWYKVKTKDGSIGYMYTGYASYMTQVLSDIKGSGITAPTNHQVGKTYILTGSVSSDYNQLTAVSAYIYAGTSEQGTAITGGKASASANSYSLSGSTVDYQTEFNKLSVGTYTYVVRAYYESYYAKTTTTVDVKTDSIIVYKATFNVSDGSASCSHTYTSKETTAATCINNGIRTYTCSKCSNSYTESIPATGYHSWGAWGVVEEATCTTDGTKFRKCYVCYEEETQSISAIGHNYSGCSCTRCGDLLVEYEIVDGEVTITDCNISISGDLVIPNAIEGYPVTAIGPNAFFRGYDLESVTIPGSVTNIGDSAFYECLNLTKVTLADGVTSIGANAFYNCMSLTDITIPGSVTHIGEFAFAWCTNLSDITIPGSGTSIGNFAFYRCENLSDVTIADGVTSIGNFAFAWCINLSDVTIPESVTSIGIAPFQSCTNLIGIRVDSENPVYTSDGRGVLFNKTMTQLIQAPCRLSGSYIVPDGVKSIGEVAFCLAEITGITIPVSVVNIKDDAFDSCSALKDVYYNGTQSQWDAIAVTSGNERLYEATLHCKQSLELQENGTLLLNEDWTTEELSISTKQVLDLNGHVLTVESLASFGQIIDSVGGGGLIVTNLALMDNDWLPILDSTGCYRFYEYEVNSLGTKETAEGATFGFTLDFVDDTAYSALLESADVAVQVTLSWGGSSKTVAFSKTLLQKYVELQSKYPQLRPYLKLSVTGLDALADGTMLTVTPAISAVGGKLNKIGEGMQYIA